MSKVDTAVTAMEDRFAKEMSKNASVAAKLEKELAEARRQLRQAPQPPAQQQPAGLMYVPPRPASSSTPVYWPGNVQGAYPVALALIIGARC